ncbi:hypothetical protein DRJ16_04345 [Candidatus Woesearchaeota archaeon]|nr:MAG: hypothetical protein DRJ16_04345 [Candidatus Woesearchaeota archaeon]
MKMANINLEQWITPYFGYEYCVSSPDKEFSIIYNPETGRNYFMYGKTMPIEGRIKMPVLAIYLTDNDDEIAKKIQKHLRRILPNETTSSKYDKQKGEILIFRNPTLSELESKLSFCEEASACFEVLKEETRKYDTGYNKKKAATIERTVQSKILKDHYLNHLEKKAAIRIYSPKGQRIKPKRSFLPFFQDLYHRFTSWLRERLFWSSP